MLRITADLLLAAVGCSQSLANTWAKPLGIVSALYEINTPARLAAFLAQVAHESVGLSRTVENLNYTADRLLAVWPSRFNQTTARQLDRKPQLIAEHVYGRRLGNTATGDGWRYRGRGLIQVTGKANYEAIRDEMRAVMRDVPNLVTDPDALAEPRWAAASAAAYWNSRGLNEPADRGAFDEITRRINGGQVGAMDRRERYARARNALAEARG